MWGHAANFDRVTRTKACAAIGVGHEVAEHSIRVRFSPRPSSSSQFYMYTSWASTAKTTAPPSALDGGSATIL